MNTAPVVRKPVGTAPGPPAAGSGAAAAKPTAGAGAGASSSTNAANAAAAAAAVANTITTTKAQEVKEVSKQLSGMDIGQTRRRLSIMGAKGADQTTLDGDKSLGESTFPFHACIMALFLPNISLDFCDRSTELLNR